MSTPRRRWTLAAAAVAAIAVLVAGACATGGRDDRAGGAATTAPAGPSSTAGAPLAVAWTGPFEVRLPNGWVARDCEGDRTNVCVYDGDRFLGDVELVNDYPLDADDAARPPRTVAREWAADMIATFRTDRSKGCAAFSYVADDVVDATVGGRQGARGGFTLKDGAGRVVERVVNYYVVSGTKAAIVGADAYVTEGGCLGPSEYDPSFVPDDLAELEPFLGRLVAESPVPVERAA